MSLIEKTDASLPALVAGFTEKINQIFPENSGATVAAAKHLEEVFAGLSPAETPQPQPPSEVAAVLKGNAK